MLEPSWCWDLWIPRGALSMICRQENSGNSLVATWMACELLRSERTSRGAERADPDRQILWLDERAGYERLLGHLRVLGTGGRGIFWPVDPRTPEEDFSDVDLNQDRWIELVTNLAAETQPMWIVVNGISSTKSPTHLQRPFEKLSELAGTTGCAVTVVVDQPNELTGSAVRKWASVAGRMAAIVALKRCRPATGDMILKVIKTNCGDRPDPLLLRLVAGVPQVMRPRTARLQSRLHRAAAFLEKQLVRGPRLAFEIIEQASDRCGISPRTLRRAKRELAIKSFHESGRWWWIAT